MFAVIETGGKQYKVSEGMIIKVEKLPYEAGNSLDLKPLIVFTDNNLVVDKDAQSYTVKTKVLREGKGEKLSVFTYRNKTNEHRRVGHRQEYTELKIEEISYGGLK